MSFLESPKLTYSLALHSLLFVNYNDSVLPQDIFDFSVSDFSGQIFIRETHFKIYNSLELLIGQLLK